MKEIQPGVFSSEWFGASGKEHQCDNMPDGYMLRHELYGYSKFGKEGWFLKVKRSIGPTTEWEYALPTREIIHSCPFCGEDLK